MELDRESKNDLQRNDEKTRDPHQSIMNEEKQQNRCKLIVADKNLDFL